MIKLDELAHRSRPFLAWARRLFIPLCLVSLGYFGWRSRDILGTVLSEAQPLYLGLAVLLWLVSHFIVPLVAVRLFRRSGVNLPYRRAFLIHANRLPARYLPGGIWHTVARVADFHRLGVDKRGLATFVMLESLTALGVAFIIGGTTVAWFASSQDLRDLTLLTGMGGAIGLMILPLLINWVASHPDYRLDIWTYGQVIGITLLFWLFAASAFVSFAIALQSAFADLPYLQVGGTYLLSWGVGYIAFFAPQGIGVFEGVAGYLLSGSLQATDMMVLVAGFRVVVLGADVLAWLLSQLLMRPHSPTQAPLPR